MSGVEKGVEVYHGKLTQALYKHIKEYLYNYTIVHLISVEWLLEHNANIALNSPLFPQ